MLEWSHANKIDTAKTANDMIRRFEFSICRSSLGDPHSAPSSTVVSLNEAKSDSLCWNKTYSGYKLY